MHVLHGCDDDESIITCLGCNELVQLLSKIDVCDRAVVITGTTTSSLLLRIGNSCRHRGTHNTNNPTGAPLYLLSCEALSMLRERELDIIILTINKHSEGAHSLRSRCSNAMVLVVAKHAISLINVGY